MLPSMQKHSTLILTPDDFGVLEPKLEHLAALGIDHNDHEVVMFVDATDVDDPTEIVLKG